MRKMQICTKLLIELYELLNSQTVIVERKLYNGDFIRYVGIVKSIADDHAVIVSKTANERESHEPVIFMGNSSTLSIYQTYRRCNVKVNSREELNEMIAMYSTLHNDIPDISTKELDFTNGVVILCRCANDTIAIGQNHQPDWLWNAASISAVTMSVQNFKDTRFDPLFANDTLGIDNKGKNVQSYVPVTDKGTMHMINDMCANIPVLFWSNSDGSNMAWTKNKSQGGCQIKIHNDDDAVAAVNAFCTLYKYEN